jgi:Mg-chelatase subunit ChlD
MYRRLVFNVYAAEPGYKLLVNNVQAEGDSITAYFDISNSEGTFNDVDVSQENVTAEADGNNLKLKGFNRFEDTKAGTAYVLMADISKSIDANSMADIMKLYSEIVNKAGENDKIALVTFGNKDTLVVDFTTNKVELLNKINAIQNKDDNTDLYRAITKALDMLTEGSALPARRAVLIASDGEESNDEGITKEEVLLKIGDSGVPIFSVGVKKDGDKNSAEKLKVLGSFARLSNGEEFLLEDSEQVIADIVSDITGRTDNSYVARFEKDSKTEGKKIEFALSVKLSEDTTLTENQSVLIKDNIIPSTKDEEESKQGEETTKDKKESVNDTDETDETEESSEESEEDLSELPEASEDAPFYKIYILLLELQGDCF